MSDTYPWDDLRPPQTVNSYTRRLIDEHSQWDTFWVVDLNDDVGLMIDCGNAKRPEMAAPELRELEVRLLSRDGDDLQILFLLRDNGFKSIFFEFCKGLHRHIEAESSIEDVAKEAVDYTWSWYRFLKGKRTEELSPEAQRGLIGELVFLRDYLVPRQSWKDAINFWSGPFGNPKDFAWGKSAAEAKTHLNDARPFIKISSEFQLDAQDINALWLFVLGFQRDSDAEDDAKTLTEVVADMISSLSSDAPELIEDFYHRLLACGYSPKHDYNKYHWRWDNPRLFRVTDGFPAIQSSGLPQGVSKVRYSVALTACEPFAADFSELGDEKNE